MTGWTPLFEQIIASSVWSLPNHIRIAWITILASTNKHGICPMTAGGLSRLAAISREEAEEALKVLSSPDADTLTQENEGRRIERVDNGWRLLNWEKYRNQAKAQVIREYNREAQANYRKNKTEAEKQKEPEPEPETKPPPPPPDEDIEAIYNAYPKKVGKPKALASINKAVEKFGHAFILERTKQYAASTIGADQQFIPNPTTWFNQERFNDEQAAGSDPNEPSLASNWARQQ